MKKVSFLIFGGLLIFSWWLGQPSAMFADRSQPPSQVRGEKISSDAAKDGMAPFCSWDREVETAHKGTVLQGKTYDLGSGAVEVAVQIQRKEDRAVWNGEKWQENVGEVLAAKVEFNNFNFKVPMELENDKEYFFRCQAVDYFGNAQLKWGEMTIIGSEPIKKI